METKGYIETIKEIWVDITNSNINDVIINYKLGNFIKTNRIGKKITYFELLTEILNKNYKSNSKYLMIFHLENKIDISLVNEHQKNIIEEFIEPLPAQTQIELETYEIEDEETQLNKMTKEITNILTNLTDIYNEDMLIDKDNMLHRLLYDADDTQFYILPKDIKFDNSSESLEFYNKHIKSYISNYDLFYNILKSICDYDEEAEAHNFTKFRE